MQEVFAVPSALRALGPVTAGLVLGSAVLAGCGQPTPVAPGAAPSAEPSPVPASPPPAPHGDADIRWAGGYCAAVSGLVQSLATVPTVDPSTPQRASTTAGELLGSVVSGLDETLRHLDRLGPSPVRGGESVRAETMATFSDIRERAEQARLKLHRTAGDVAASRDALGDARLPLDAIGELNPLDGFDEAPELASAGRRAPECLRLVEQATPSSLQQPTS